MHPDDPLPFGAADEAFERLLFALQPVDGLRLRPVFVHREHETPVQQFLIDVRRRRRQKEHHRAFYPVFVRDELSRRRVLSRRRDRERSFALQQFQGIGRAARAFFFHDGEDLVFQIHLAHVVERLAGHGRVLDARFLRHQVQHGVHQRAFPGSR